MEKLGPPHRLLYRGALSLPDSHLLLDGLTFFASVLGTGINLLQNPLALALESMRGRPSLSFVRVEKLHDLVLDTSGDIRLDIHPDAALSNIYFQNTFCQLPYESISKEGRSEVGVRVSLGDLTNMASTSTVTTGMTEMVIYARHAMPLAHTTHTPITLQLCVAHIVPNHPPPVGVRPPRPDDPTPRRPPMVYCKPTAKRARHKEDDARMASLAASIDKGKGKQAKLTPSATTTNGAALNGTGKGKGKATNVARLGSGVRVGNDSVFKVPAVPAHRRGSSVDVDSMNSHMEVEETEKANKTLIKKTAVAQLAARGISRTHPEFTDLYGHVYRGAAFALRTVSKAQTSHLDRPTVEHMVEAHVRMYVREGNTGVNTGEVMVP